MLFLKAPGLDTVEGNSFRRKTGGFSDRCWADISKKAGFLLFLAHSWKSELSKLQHVIPGDSWQCEIFKHVQSA